MTKKIDLNPQYTPQIHYHEAGEDFKQSSWVTVNLIKQWPLKILQQGGGGGKEKEGHHKNKSHIRKEQKGKLRKQNPVHGGQS